MWWCMHLCYGFKSYHNLTVVLVIRVLQRATMYGDIDQSYVLHSPSNTLVLLMRRHTIYSIEHCSHKLKTIVYTLTMDPSLLIVVVHAPVLWFQVSLNCCTSKGVATYHYVCMVMSELCNALVLLMHRHTTMLCFQQICSQVNRWLHQSQI